MVRPLRVKPPKKQLPKEKQGVSPLLWYGGKQSIADWIVGHLPPHNTYVELFGGGGSVIFRKLPSKLDIYNDIGNATNFFRVLRNHGEELYEKLYYTPYGRQEFYSCRTRWKELSDLYINKLQLSFEDEIEWARCWFVTLTQGYAHEESTKSPWKPSKTNDLAFSWTNRVEDLTRFTERLRGIVLESVDFDRAIDMYDSPVTLFYADPPYTEGSRVTQNNYVHEMPRDQHLLLLKKLKSIKGQAMVSMYDDPVYNRELADWRCDTITHVSGVQNAKSMADGRGNRTEKLWLKEHHYGLWTPFPTTPPDVSREAELTGAEQQTSPLV